LGARYEQSSRRSAIEELCVSKLEEFESVAKYGTIGSVGFSRSRSTEENGKLLINKVLPASGVYSMDRSLYGRMIFLETTGSH